MVILKSRKKKRGKSLKNLIIFEFADEIDAFLKLRGERYLRRNDVNILALEPNAQAMLRRLDISHFNSLPFLGRNGHEDILLASDRIIQAIRKEICIKDDLGVTEGYNNALLFYLRSFLHHLLFLVEVLCNAAVTLKPQKMIVPQEHIPMNRQQEISHAERYTGEVAHLYCLAHELDFEIFPQTCERIASQGRTGFGKPLVNLARNILFLLNLLCYKFVFNKKSFILAFAQDFNMPRIMRRFQDVYKNVAPVYLHSNNPKSDIRKMLHREPFWSFISLPTFVPKWKSNHFKSILQKNLKRLEEMVINEPDLFTYKKVDLSQLVFSFCTQGLTHFLSKLYGQTFWLDKILKKSAPALIVSQQSRMLGYNLGELSRHYSIPSLMISHGSHVPPRNRFETIEWGEHGLGLMNTHYEFLAIQTPWAKEYLERVPTHSKTITTGPLLFANKSFCSETKDVLRKRILPNIKERTIILHAGTPKRRVGMRFYVYETVDEYIDNINDLIRAVETLSGIYLVVRFRPLPNLSTEDLHTLLVPSESYAIHSGGSFNDYLHLSDLLVSYSSTAIEEALQNQIPVLQYDPQGKYCHIPGEILTSGSRPNVNSCYFAGSKNDLPWGLKWIIENHLTQRATPDIWERHKFKDKELVDLTTYFQIDKRQL